MFYRQGVTNKPTGFSGYPSFFSAEFGRLLVKVGKDLTLDDCLKMASLFSVPRSQVDLLLRISSYQTPGNKLLDIFIERNIINMYDVTNLQKALKLMKLLVTEQKVGTFQNQVDHEQHEYHKAPEMIRLEGNICI